MAIPMIRHSSVDLKHQGSSKREREGGSEEEKGRARETEGGENQRASERARERAREGHLPPAWSRCQSVCAGLWERGPAWLGLLTARERAAARWSLLAPRGDHGPRCGTDSSRSLLTHGRCVHTVLVHSSTRRTPFGVRVAVVVLCLPLSPPWSGLFSRAHRFFTEHVFFLSR